MLINLHLFPDTFNQLEDVISTYSPLSQELSRILGETQFRVDIATEQIASFKRIETEELEALPDTHFKIKRLQSMNISRAVPGFNIPDLSGGRGDVGDDVKNVRSRDVK